jgi:hypothetical protein
MVMFFGAASAAWAKLQGFACMRSACLNALHPTEDFGGPLSGSLPDPRITGERSRTGIYQQLCVASLAQVDVGFECVHVSLLIVILHPLIETHGFQKGRKNSGQ